MDNKKKYLKYKKKYLNTKKILKGGMSGDIIGIIVSVLAALSIGGIIYNKAEAEYKWGEELAEEWKEWERRKRVEVLARSLDAERLEAGRVGRGVGAEAEAEPAQEGEGRGEVAQAEEAQAEEAEPAQEGETPTTLFDWAQHDTERSTFI